MSEGRTTSFRRVLPIAELMLCAVLLWPWRGFLMLQMQATAHGHWPTKVAKPVFYLNTTQAAETLQKSRAAKLAEIRVTTPALLNLPSVFLGLARSASVPMGMLPVFWRSISWPIAGLIFWWIAGRGIDALFSSKGRGLSPSITWVETFLAAVVVAGCIAVCIGFLSDESFRSEFIYPWPFAAVASGLWIALGITTIAARLVQWGIRRKLRVEPSASV